MLVGNGFYFKLGRKEYFCITEYKNKTKALASKILRVLLLPDNPDTQKELLYYMRSATCEIKHNEKFNRDYYNIYGDNFGGCGSDDVNDGFTVVFSI